VPFFGFIAFYRSSKALGLLGRHGKRIATHCRFDSARRCKE
jgi:hypothetical protein